MELKGSLYGGGQSHGVSIRLEPGERIHMLNPKLIVAFQGPSSQREDRLMTLKGMYRKKKLIQADLSGPAELIAALPAGFYLKHLTVDEGSGLLFEFRNLLYYSSGVQMSTVVLNIRNMIVTRDILKMKFTGSGTLGIISRGPIYEMDLDETVPLYVDSSCLVAYPHDAAIEPCVYGNHLASQHMNYQWKLTGRGKALVQMGKPDKQVEADPGSDGLVRRVLREVLPFGGVFIK